MLYVDYGWDMKIVMSGYGYIVMIYGFWFLLCGYVGLYSVDFFVVLLIDFNYMVEFVDVERFVWGVCLVCRILE